VEKFLLFFSFMEDNEHFQTHRLSSFEYKNFFKKSLFFSIGYYIPQPVPVAARSKAWACGRSLVGIEGLNPAGGMGVCLL
jgi:hypothetical protein